MSQTLCSGAFVSGVDPDQLYREVIEPNPGIRRLAKRLKYHVDKSQKQVATTWAGRFQSRSIYRDGFGCTLLPAATSEATLPISPPPSFTATEELQTESRSPTLESALDLAFEEPSAPPHKWVKAIVILQDGKVAAERYASGYGVSTPLFGYSLSKSVINALIGILVRQGKLSVDQPAPVPEWRNSDDPRHVITINQLLRMTSGLDLDENDSGFDPVSRMLFLEPDMAGFAARARLRNPPGTIFNHTSGNTLILSRIIRDAVGGRAEDVVAFA